MWIGGNWLRRCHVSLLRGNKRNLCNNRRISRHWLGCHPCSLVNTGTAWAALLCSRCRWYLGTSNLWWSMRRSLHHCRSRRREPGGLIRGPVEKVRKVRIFLTAVLPIKRKRHRARLSRHLPGTLPSLRTKPIPPAVGRVCMVPPILQVRVDLWRLQRRHWVLVLMLSMRRRLALLQERTRC